MLTDLDELRISISIILFPVIELGELGVEASMGTTFLSDAVDVFADKPATRHVVWFTYLLNYHYLHHCILLSYISTKSSSFSRSSSKYFNSTSFWHNYTTFYTFLNLLIKRFLAAIFIFLSCLDYPDIQGKHIQPNTQIPIYSF